MSTEVGLYWKYRVERLDGKPIDWCFVLEATDPLALPALRAYARAARDAGYGLLADDLDAKCKQLARDEYECLRRLADLWREQLALGTTQGGGRAYNQHCMQHSEASDLLAALDALGA